MYNISWTYTSVSIIWTVGSKQLLLKNTVLCITLGEIAYNDNNSVLLQNIYQMYKNLLFEISSLSVKKSYTSKDFREIETESNNLV